MRILLDEFPSSLRCRRWRPEGFWPLWRTYHASRRGSWGLYFWFPPSSLLSTERRGIREDAFPLLAKKKLVWVRVVYSKGKQAFCMVIGFTSSHVCFPCLFGLVFRDVAAFVAVLPARHGCDRGIFSELPMESEASGNLFAFSWFPPFVFHCYMSFMSCILRSGMLCSCGATPWKRWRGPIAINSFR